MEGIFFTSWAIRETLRDVWDNIKHMNIQIIEITEEEEKKTHEKIVEEIIVKKHY